MNQIETLKYIAKHGNPIRTPAKSDYNKYKSDRINLINLFNTTDH